MVWFRKKKDHHRVVWPVVIGCITHGITIDVVCVWEMEKFYLKHIHCKVV